MLTDSQAKALPGEPAQAKAAAPLTLEAIKQAIDELRPHLRADGGDCELVGVEGNLVTVRLLGACIGCQLSSLTLNGLQERLIRKLGVPLRIAPVMAH